MDKKNITKNYQNTIGRAIKKRGIPQLRLISKSTIFQIGLGYRQRRFLYDDINGAVATKICDNKNRTKYFLEQLGAPIPRGECIYNEQELKAAFIKFKKPIVIKPVSEMWGRGISTNIMTFTEAKKAYALAKKYKGEYIIAEEHIQGDDHRILILNDTYIAGLRRKPPFLIGDGKDSIEKLVYKENIRRQRSKKIIKTIIIDKAVDNFLSKQGISLKTIPKKGEVIKIRMTGNICSGGVSENITEQVHQSTIDLCKDIVACLGLEIGGVDVITTDITRPLEETDGRISEVNQNPDIEMHTAPYVGAPIDTAQMFVDYLFKNKEEAWIDIKKNGRKITKQSDLYKYLEVVPKKVVRFNNGSHSNKVTISNPDKPLLNYLLNKFTYSVQF